MGEGVGVVVFAQEDVLVELSCRISSAFKTAPQPGISGPLRVQHIMMMKTMMMVMIIHKISCMQKYTTSLGKSGPRGFNMMMILMLTEMMLMKMMNIIQR